MNKYETPRKSFMYPGNIYFWTATINNWQALLLPDNVKEIIISSLRYLSEKKKIKVYAFVVMPNHIHFIWETLQKNGKENAQASFLKFTAHEFKKYLVRHQPGKLPAFAIKAHNKAYEFWRRDSLAFLLTKRATALQKLEYVHKNPLGAKWNLCNEPAQYYYSSASYYETGIDTFGFLHHLMDEF